MITGYYLIYSNETADEILEHLDLNALSSSVDKNIDVENDVVFANAIYKLACENKKYSRRGLKDLLYYRIKTKYVQWESDPNTGKLPYDNYRDFFEPLFDYVWNKPFDLKENGKLKTKLSQRTWDCQPIQERILNNNITFVGIIIIAIILFFIIGNHFYVPSLLTVGIQGSILIFALSNGVTTKKITRTTITGCVCCIISAIYFLFTNHFSYAKGFICMMASYIIFQIAVFFNEDRLRDQTSEKSTSY